MEVTVPSSAYCGFYNKPSGPETNLQSVSDLMLQQQGQQLSAKRQYRGGPPPPHMLQPYRQQQPQFKRKFNNGSGNNSSVVVAPQRPPVQQFHCELCDAKCTGEAMFKLHREGSKHLKKEKEKKFRELSEAKDPEVYCDICNLTLHPELMKSHRAGVKHRKAAAGALNRGGSGAKKSPTGKSALPPGIYRLDPAESAADKDKFAAKASCAKCAIQLLLPRPNGGAPERLQHALRQHGGYIPEGHEFYAKYMKRQEAMLSYRKIRIN
uniref:C2H2-type domain-containing protein n=1 Tax=Macrostomum lignano TaxID=282301 RepID=A0A1I8F2X5_9PLAT